MMEHSWANTSGAQLALQPVRRRPRGMAVVMVSALGALVFPLALVGGTPVLAASE